MKNIWIIFTLLVGLFLLGCNKKPSVDYTMGKADNTPYKTQECIYKLTHNDELIGTKIDRIEVFKAKRKMYAYAQNELLYEFKLSLGKNADKGHKLQAGDYRTPEGNYKIVRKKCDDRLYKSLMISYPNNDDLALASSAGLRVGGYITIHGQPKWNADGRGDSYTLSNDWTEGCIAVSNKNIDKLWKAVENGVKINIYP